MIELPEQSAARRGRDFVDTQMLGEKQSSRAFRGAAYTIGIALGCLVLSLIVPTFEDKRVGDMVELIRVTAFWMLGYAAIVVFAYVKMRAQMRAVLFLLNWILVPTFGVWFILRVMDIFSNIPPELQP